jgi:hypothetical protein
VQVTVALVVPGANSGRRALIVAVLWAWESSAFPTPQA